MTVDTYTWICGRARTPGNDLLDYSRIKKFAAEQGIELSIDRQRRDDPASYVRAIETAVSESVRSIMLTAPADDAITRAIGLAGEAGIPVVTVNEDIPLSERMVHVGTDWFRMGSVIAAHAIERTAGTGDIIPVATVVTPHIHAAWSGFSYHIRMRSALRLPDMHDDGPIVIAPEAPQWDQFPVPESGQACIVGFDADAVFSVLEGVGGRLSSSVTLIGIDPHAALAEYVRSGRIGEIYLPRIEVAGLHAVALMHAHNYGSSARAYRPGVGNVPGHIDVGFDMITPENAATVIENEQTGHPVISAEIERLSAYMSRFSGPLSLEREEKGRTRAILNAIPDIIFQIDKDGTFIGYKADRSEELFVMPEEFLGKKIDEVLPPYLAEKTIRHLHSVLEKGGVESYEYELEIDGDLLQFEARMAATGPNDVIAIIRNITDRVRAEEALRESEERFRVAFKTSPDAISITGIEDGLYVDINDGFETLTGYSREEAIGNSAINMDIWHNPKDRDRLVRALKDTGYITNLEAEFRLKDGRIRTGLMSARIVLLHGKGYILSVTRDITEWKKAEEALRESEERFRAVFETALDPIYIKDRNLNYVAINPSMAQLFDIPQTKFVGKSYEEVLGSVNAEHNREVETRVLNGEIVSEESVRTISGEERLFHVVMVPLRIDGGEIIGLCGIAREMTEIRRLQQDAERAGRLETAGTIAGQVAHDFNNLLGPLMAYPDIIRESLPSDSEAYQLLDDMEYAAEQMADINQQLLTLGRRGHYSREPFNLNEVVRQVVDRLPASSKKLSIETELHPNLKNVMGGAAQMYRVVLNLVTNACDAMKHEGRLSITTENVHLPTRTGRHTAIPEGEYVRLTVTDTGPGIPPDIVQNIFDPFFTTKKADKKRGSGLGLSVVHSVVEDHGGFIDLDTAPGEGTTFRIYLPITDDEIEMRADRAIAGGDERILVVDDDHTQLDVIATMLSKLGYTVECAESGEDAVRLLEQQEYDLLLLDMVMPSGIDGTETYRKALSLYPNQPAIMMSGFAETKQVKEALRLGAGMFIRKPFSQMMLAGAVRRELDRVVKKSTGD